MPVCHGSHRLIWQLEPVPRPTLVDQLRGTRFRVPCPHEVSPITHLLRFAGVLPSPVVSQNQQPYRDDPNQPWGQTRSYHGNRKGAAR